MSESGAVVPGDGAEFVVEQPEQKGWLDGFISAVLASQLRLIILVALCLFPLIVHIHTYN